MFFTALVITSVKKERVGKRLFKNRLATRSFAREYV